MVSLLEYVFFIVGTIIGAGILGLPIVMKNFSFFSIVVLFLGVLITFFASLVFVKTYAFGIPFKGILKHIVKLAIFVSGFSALLAYTIGIDRIFSGQGIVFIPFVLFLINFLQIKREIKFDSLMSFGMFSMLVILMVYLISNSSLNPVEVDFSFFDFFKALSVSLFAFSGYFSLIDVYHLDKKDFLKILALALGLVFFVYSIYTLLAIFSGIDDIYSTTNKTLMLITKLFGFFSMTTSAIGVFIGLKTNLNIKSRSNEMIIFLLVVALVVRILNVKFEDLINIGSKFGLSIFVGVAPMLYGLKHFSLKYKIFALFSGISFILVLVFS